MVTLAREGKVLRPHSAADFTTSMLTKGKPSLPSPTFCLALSREEMKTFTARQTWSCLIHDGGAGFQACIQSPDIMQG